ncbi:hypothetical protein PENSPDRAFT_351011 [Peniophora sp. CONT]|nr:hypothetical protein PENSPDRAFT_351011 [Peniophora sp. CONT]
MHRMSRDIDSLPADILSELFLRASFTDPPRYLSRSERRAHPGRTYELGWINLTHVCHTWRLIGLDLAPLWAAIVSFFPSPFIADELLARSRDCGLQLELRGPLENWMVQHLDRASKVTVGFATTSHVQDILRDAHLPALRTLVMRQGAFNRNPVRIDAPGLREVQLNESVLLFAFEMHQVTTLEITHVYYTLHDMIATLLLLPRLEKLRLFHGGEWSAPFPHIVARLQHLTTFNMHATHSQTFVNLWKHLSVPAAAAIQLITNDIPEVSSLFTILQPQLTLASHDSLNICSSGFALSTGERDSDGRYVACVDWLYASGKDIGHASLDILEHLRSHILVANILKCELELPSEMKELDVLGSDSLAHRVCGALNALGGALANTSTLALQGLEPDRVLLRSLVPRGSFIPFPRLQSLLLGKHESSWVARHRITGLGPCVIQADWPLIETALAARKQAGAPVNRLVLAGEWCTREEETQSWTMQWSEHSIRCCSLELVREVKDERVLQALCSTCDIPELEEVSDWEEGSDLDIFE